MQEHEYMLLISGKLAGELTPEDTERLEVWLEESAENRQLFEEYKKLWAINTPQRPPRPLDIEDSWNNLAKNLKLDQQTALDSKPRMTQWDSWWFRAAAAIAILISLSFLIRYIQGPSEDEMIVYVTPNAVRNTIDLPDGSTAMLNNGSELKVSNEYSRNRVVYLKGEALFDVKKSAIPFRVVTNEAEIEVLGTRFNVRTRDRNTRVIVQSGTVKLSNPALSAEKAVVLKKNEQSICTVDSAPLPAQPIDSDYRLGWLRNELVFEKTPLPEVIAELERNFNVNILLDNQAKQSRATQTISGSFKITELETILDELTLTLNMNYQKRENTYLLLAN